MAKNDFEIILIEGLSAFQDQVNIYDLIWKANLRIYNLREI